MGELHGAAAGGTRRVFAVWLELPPGTTLEGQGIVVLLVRLIAAAAKRRDVRIVVGCAAWTRTPLLDLLEAYGVPPESVDVITGRRHVPPLVALALAWWTGTRRRRPWRVRQWVRNATERLQRTVPRLAARAITQPGPALVVLAPAWIVGALAASLVTAPAAVIVRGVRAAIRWSARRLAAPKERLLGSMRRLAEEVYPHVNTLEHVRAARACRRSDVPAWLALSPGTQSAAALGPNVAFAVADLVPIDYPLRFARAGMAGSMRKVLGNLHTGVAAAQVSVSYSPFVRNEHVIRALGIPAAQAKVVPHAPPDTHERAYHLDDPHRDARLLAAYLASDAARASWSATATGGMIHHLDLLEVPYLLVSSQLRPHKNTVNAIRAFARLLRHHGVACKLVLTGDFRHDPDAQAAVLEHGLAFDVLSLPKVPAEAHVALLRRAALSVVPTLFEGGFPFGFSEALAVGTPVMMSRIPVVEGIVPPDLAAVMTFDPFDPVDMAERWRWALEHRAELLALQQPLARQLTERTWDDALDEYLAVLAEVAERGC